MSNMSYCRFQNTVNDFEDCANHIHEKVSRYELRSKIELVKQAATMLEDLGITIDPNELRDAINHIKAIGTDQDDDDSN